MMMKPNISQGAGLAKGTPDSETDPEVGIYLNEQNPSKLGWYIDRKTQITKTGQNADGSKTYHVTYTLTNTLTSSEMAICTGYILGGEQAGVTGKPVAAPGNVCAAYAVLRAKGWFHQRDHLIRRRARPKQCCDGWSKTGHQCGLYRPRRKRDFRFRRDHLAEGPKNDLTIDQTPSGKMTNEVNYQY